METNKSLISIAENYKTDKLEHGYIKIYENYFEKIRDKNLQILEIGIADGKSLLSWSEYFKNSTIVGIDIHKINLKEKGLDKKNIKVHQGSQSDEVFINNLLIKYDYFDIITDDGSHLKKDVIKSFQLLFPSLVNDGLYIVKDMQTSYNHFFWRKPI